MSHVYVQLHMRDDIWTYDATARTYAHFSEVYQACEHFTKLLIVTGAEPRFVFGSGSKSCFKLWLNNQPNKVELAELLNLQEMVS